MAGALVVVLMSGLIDHARKTDRRLGRLEARVEALDRPPLLRWRTPDSGR